MCRGHSEARLNRSGEGLHEDFITLICIILRIAGATESSFTAALCNCNIKQTSENDDPITRRLRSVSMIDSMHFYCLRKFSAGETVKVFSFRESCATIGCIFASCMLSVALARRLVRCCLQGPNVSEGGRIRPVVPTCPESLLKEKISVLHSHEK